MASPCAAGASPVVSGIVAVASFALPFGVLQRELAIVHRGNAMTTMYNALVGGGIAAIVFFFFGYAFSNGFIAGREQQEFIGERFFFFLTRDDCAFMDVLTEMARALSVIFIILGTVTERIHTYAVSALAFFVPSFIYAVPRYWTAGDNSWLLKGTAHLQDLSGNASMFFMAGVMALVVLLYAGTRLASAGGSAAAMNHPSGILSSFGTQAIGGIFLLGFASLRRADQTGDVIDVVDNPGPRSILAAVNIVVSMALAAVTSLGVHQFFSERWGHLPPYLIIRMATASALTGMVTVSGVAAVTSPEVVIPLGVLAGIVCRAVMLYLVRRNLDDATDAIPIYLGGGLLGLLVAPFWDDQDGIFYHVGEWDGLGWNLLAAVCLAAWCATLVAVICYGLKYIDAISFAKANLQDPRGLDVSLFVTRPSDGVDMTQLTTASGGNEVPEAQQRGARAGVIAPEGEEAGNPYDPNTNPKKPRHGRYVLPDDARRSPAITATTAPQATTAGQQHSTPATHHHASGRATSETRFVVSPAHQYRHSPRSATSPTLPGLFTGDVEV